MAWEISHAAEAWDNARAQLATWEREELIEALCDEAFERVDDDLQELVADALRERLQAADHDALVDACIEAIERGNTCDSGGHNFWIDREGYHTVSCSPVAEEECEA